MLRNTSGLLGYWLRANDGDMGSIEDFYFDDASWTIRYLVVTTGTWLEGRSVLISPISLGALNSSAKLVEVNLSKRQIENSPPIDTHRPVYASTRPHTSIIMATHTIEAGLTYGDRWFTFEPAGCKRNANLRRWD